MILCRCHEHPCSSRAKPSILHLISGHKEGKMAQNGEAPGLGQVWGHHGLHVWWVTSHATGSKLACPGPLGSLESLLFIQFWMRSTHAGRIYKYHHPCAKKQCSPRAPPPTNKSLLCATHTHSPRISENLLIHTHQVNSIFFPPFEETPTWENLSPELKK